MSVPSFRQLALSLSRHLCCFLDGSDGEGEVILLLAEQVKDGCGVGWADGQTALQAAR